MLRRSFIAGLSAFVSPVQAKGKPMHTLAPRWSFVSDRVMGGVSDGKAASEQIAGRAAARLTGSVSLDNNGGFVQMAFDTDPALEFGTWTGLELDIFGNGEEYDLRLRTDALTRPWQSFRTTFIAEPRWQSLRFPFDAFAPHRTEATFDPVGIRRIGVLAIGREFDADIAVSAVRLYC